MKGTVEMEYAFRDIEAKWQKHWEENKTFKTDETDQTKPKYYVLDMFPYPSGSGLHVGHPEGYTATDILARYKRMSGYNVLHPMGWDAFGLPAEQYAIKTGTHPRITTEKNIIRFREQLKTLGFSYDWDREVDTTDPKYYRWTQWIFLQLYHKGLAYVAEVPVNWCPALGTVLANEEVIDGRSEIGNHPVYRKPMRQWMLKITEYAERLISDLEGLDWPESIKEMQRNWIGRSEGAEVSFAVDDHQDKAIRVFTTRPDTLFGATYMVLSPEHELVEQIATDEHRSSIKAYQAAASQKSDLERTELQKEKTGVPTGAFAINPVTSGKIPIWIADYVLASYGTGAIMAVPGHDERDWEFAKAYDLPIVEVISGGDVNEAAYSGDGALVNSAGPGLDINGLNVSDAKRKMIDWLEKGDLGEGKVNYKLRDWLFSRQRYWGEPFPILHHPDGQSEAIGEDELPLLLPEMEDFKPTPLEENEQPKPPLGRAPDNWKFVEKDGVIYTREFNTMPQWAGSCWYYLRYIDPLNDEKFLDPEKENYWMPVDLYVGGAEHAVLHLLYARFWHKVLYDLGHVSTVEPFQKLVNQGMILGEMEFTLYKDADGNPVSAKDVQQSDLDEETGNGTTACKLTADEVDKKGDSFVWKENGSIRIEARAHKMSKSRGNVINPDTVVEAYGADSLRLYEMFMGPLEQVKPWSMKGVEGVHRFLKRAWRLVINLDGELDKRIVDEKPNKEQLFQLHSMLKKVTEDLDGMRFNTAIAAMMSFVNEAMKWDSCPKSVVNEFLVTLSPFAPHLAEELYERLNQTADKSIAYYAWPKFDTAHLKQDSTEVVIQVNGKLRQRLTVDIGLSKEALQEAAMNDERITNLIEGKEIIRVIAVPNKLVNIVVKG